MLPPKVTSKELSKARADECLEVTRPTIPIYTHIQCFIDKKTKVTWSIIYNTLMQENFPWDLEYLHAYINIKKSRMHKVTCKFLVMQFVELIKWIITHMDDSHIVL